jgi:HAD superfamily hydrolase (TIGR01450 family)
VWRVTAALSPLLAGYANVILDLDGTIWVGDELIPRAAAAVTALRMAGIGIAFVTNDGSRSPEEYVQRLWALGVTAAGDEVVSVGSAITHVLCEREAGARVYVIGAPAIFRHVTDAGHRIVNGTSVAERADVVVAVAHPEFNYRELTIATRALLGGAQLICGGRDRTYPAGDGTAPGTGALTAALEYATGVTARMVGKPDPRVFEVALQRLRPGRTLVVGDHHEADLGGAAAPGLDAAIVLSGVSTEAQARAATDPAPVAIATDLATLVLSS